jgi:hypothetical protein
LPPVCLPALLLLSGFAAFASPLLLPPALLL